jgi:membrane protein DedA with SNARE-associated domain
MTAYEYIDVAVSLVRDYAASMTEYVRAGISVLVEKIVVFVREHEGWTAPVAFMVAFLESFCFLSIVWPGTAIFVGLAAVLAKGGIESHILIPAILGAGLGGTLGYAVSYWIGLYYKEDIKGVWPFSRYPGMLEKGQTFFDRWGAVGVFLGHFVGPVRAVIPVVAGMYAVPQWQFQLANITSAFIWAIGVIAPSYFGLQYFLG